MDWSDFPEKTIEELKKAERAQIEEILNGALRIAAVAQQKLLITSVYSTRQGNGDVLISVVADSGSANISYARVSRSTEMVIQGVLPAVRPDRLT